MPIPRKAGEFRALSSREAMDPNGPAFVLLPSIRGNVPTADYPGIPEGARSLRPVGVFDLEEGQRHNADLIRGWMEWVPGGVIAPPTFNRAETLKRYAKQMEGIPEGHMPAFINQMRPAPPQARTAPAEQAAPAPSSSAPIPAAPGPTRQKPFANTDPATVELFRRLGIPVD